MGESLETIINAPRLKCLLGYRTLLEFLTELSVFSHQIQIPF